MSSTNQRVSSTHDELLVRHGETEDPAPQLHPPQPPFVGLRHPASYEHSSTCMTGNSQAHFGDIYHVSQAALPPKVEVSQANNSPSLTSWLASIISSGWQRWAKANHLQSQLGDWISEARNSTGEWLIPVLSTSAFEQHLIDHEAKFKPSVPCTSTFAWAQLLHLFEINPGQGVIIWRRAKPDEDPLIFGTLNLDLDGQSLCHIVNIYGETIESAPDSNYLHVSIHTSNLTIETSGEIVGVNFRVNTLNRAKPHERYLGSFQMERYLRALRQGTSEEKLTLPHHSQPLKDRIKALQKVEEVSWPRPMVTSAWLEQASRIKRRVTTNGGKDELLQKSLIRALSADTTVAEAATNLAELHVLYAYAQIPTIGERANEFVRTAVQVVQPMFMYSNSGFETRDREWDLDNNPSCGIDGEDDDIVPVVLSRMSAALEKLCGEMKGTWISELSQVVPGVEEILCLPRFLDRYVTEVRFDTNSRLWKSTCRVLG